MSVGGFVRRNTFWAKDRLFRGGLVYNQYREIKRVLAAQDMGFTLKKLDEVKRHAIASVPFYAKYKPGDTFPVVNKKVFLADQDAFRSSAYAGQALHTMSTSGSTGVPLTVTQDKRKRARNIADLKVYGELAEYPSHERMVMLRELNPRNIRSNRQNVLENIYRMDCVNIEQNLPQMLALIQRKRPAILFAYPSNLVALATYMKKNGIDGKSLGLTSLMSVGETTEKSGHELLLEVFGRPHYRRYGNQELGIMGQDDGAWGPYRLNFASYYIECLKMDSDEAAAPGEVGRVVVTDLFNYAFPMIRYDTGDVGVMEYPEEGGFPVFKELYGRKMYVIYNTRGELVLSLGIGDLFWGIPGFRQYQLVQKGAKEYLLKLNLEQECDLAPIEDSLRGLLGQDADITIQLVDEVPVLASHKRAPVVCEWEGPKGE